MKKKLLIYVFISTSIFSSTKDIQNDSFLHDENNELNTIQRKKINHSSHINHTANPNNNFEKIQPKKSMTCLTYMANDNDLDYFAKKNLEDMKKIGSSDFINILVQMDGQGPYQKTKRFYVEKNNLIQVNKKDPLSEKKLDFGSAETLADSCIWAIKKYPADHYVLILWNHGIGILDSIGGKTSNASEVFNFNPDTNMLEINRQIDFLEYAKQREEEKRDRGICFSDTFGTYLTNQKLIDALATVKQQTNGIKFDIIAFDACLMGMIEVGNLLSPFANIMVGSQELELGAGYPYHKIFEPFLTKALKPYEFAQHIVAEYSNHYKNISNDYTLSAIDLTELYKVEISLEKTISLLLEALQYQRNNSVHRLIQISKNRRMCTCFSEPTYIDLCDFLNNMIESIEHMNIDQEKAFIKTELKESFIQTRNLVKTVIFANESGKNLPKAYGLSIYFPIRGIHSSYLKTPFAQNYSWTKLIRAII